MSDEPHFWLDGDEVYEYVPLAGPTLIRPEEVCRRMNNMRESLKDYQRQILDLEAPPPERTHAFTCPSCGSHWFGTSCHGTERFDWIVNCHGAPSCGFKGSYEEHVNNDDLS